MNRERVRDLFAEALDLPADRRSAWLAGQCGDDAATRAEVERLLRADAKAQDFMEHPPASLADAAGAAAGEVALAAFGVFRVVRSIGQGGMGEVWLAERNDGEFEQRVAVKRLTYPTPGLKQRFRQERQILARLEHPNFARLIDGGLDANGVPYLAMEYVEGVPITDYVR
ncbi:MAG TPA: protein kinase, partial [Rhodanobacteraceae bacterium]|nr:protein kinase [Rhodanobacteraceae bacterium]